MEFKFIVNTHLHKHDSNFHFLADDSKTSTAFDAFVCIFILQNCNSITCKIFRFLQPTLKGFNSRVTNGVLKWNYNSLLLIGFEWIK